MVEPVAIAGLAQSRQGDHSDVPQAYLWWDIVEQACADAGLTLDDIDAVVGEGPAGIGLRGHMPGAGIAEQLGRPLRFHARSETGAASTLSGMSLAAHAISTGLAEVAVIATAAAGREGGYASADRQAAIAHMAKLSGPYEYPYGTTRVSDYAVYAMRHAYEHGTTSAQLAEVAVAQRHAATLHPLSINGWRGEITVDDVLGSPLIADPLHLLDCCVVNQGAGAIVMTRADDARAAGHHQPVLLLGYGEGHSHIDPNALDSLVESPAATVAATGAFGRAGVTPGDIDVAGISDHFTIGVLLGLEDAGFCARGESGSFVEHGGTGLGGHLPTNTSGGHLSFSHAGMCGVFTVIEVVEQLRGEASDRQVPDAALGFVTGVGGAQQATSAAVLGRG
ncbi:MAG: thiolase family protein [Actinomycetota bacterium]|nr:thiolase family protein [Actinomycetota bacterium]